MPSTTFCGLQPSDFYICCWFSTISYDFQFLFADVFSDVQKTCPPWVAFWNGCLVVAVVCRRSFRSYRWLLYIRLRRQAGNKQSTDRLLYRQAEIIMQTYAGWKKQTDVCRNTLKRARVVGACRCKRRIVGYVLETAVPARKFPGWRLGGGFETLTAWHRRPPLSECDFKEGSFFVTGQPRCAFQQRTDTLNIKFV